MLRRLITTISTVAEWAFSPRTLVVCLFLAATVLTLLGWLRPPLSRDLSLVNLPLGIWTSSASVPDAASPLAGCWRIFSVGGWMLLYLMVGVVLVILDPRRMSYYCGGLLLLAVVANLLVLFNHPLLIESLDAELASREHMAAMVSGLNSSSVTVTGQPRVLSTSEIQSNLFQGFVYRRYGALLIVLASASLLLALSGPLSRRLTVLFAYGGVGVAVGLIGCSQRFTAEHYWSHAYDLEAEGKLTDARETLAQAVRTMPQLGELQRTWLLAGRIDFGQGVNSAAARFLLADRLAHDLDLHAALAESRQLMQLSAESIAVRRQAAWLWTLDGRNQYALGRLTAAYDAWKQAHEIDPARLDCPMYLGLVQAKIDRANPDKAHYWLDLFVSRTADLLLKADLLASIGDVYFESGQYVEARTYYQRSLRVYELPKRINYRARKGLLGM